MNFLLGYTAVEFNICNICESFMFPQLQRPVQPVLSGKSVSECSGRTDSSHSRLIELMRAIMAIMAIRSQGCPGVTFANILTNVTCRSRKLGN